MRHKKKRNKRKWRNIHSRYGKYNDDFVFNFERGELNYATKHHRKPRSKGGRGTSENISIITAKMHRAWHILFKNFDPHDIHRIVCEITQVYLDPGYVLIMVHKDDM